ncbi:MAG TPA: heavy metal translocating P-type ATPase metal-binding domain-containing protein, partial [Deferrisomatales bacterium]|nr:heavy metal translocating P-type ATPase metal-binding domain-containing protein [Deferrisomatales bacterium]
MTDTSLCVHCRLPIPPVDLVLDTVDGTELAFCCHGCAGAYRIITGAGLGAFYRQRTWDEAGTPDGAFAETYSDEYLEPFVHRGDDGAELSVLVDGIRCASCVWVVEKIAGDLPGVRDVRVNFATHRARVRFDPESAAPSAIFAAIARIGYAPRPYSPGAADQAAAAERRSLLLRFGTAAFLSMQLMVYSLGLYAGYFQGMDPGTHRLLQYLAWLVATPVVLYAGSPFLSGAWRSLRNRSPNMDLLIALGVLSAYGTSVFAVFTGGEVYFDTAAMIVTLILTGRLFEMTARRRAASGIDRLLRLVPELAHRVRDGGMIEVATSALEPGDTIEVRPGERFPADGVLAGGATEVDESAVSGEPGPVFRGPGEAVNSGTLNLSTAVTVQVTATAAGSFVGRMARL